MKVMVIGSSGQLGSEIVELKELLKPSSIAFYNKDELDISSPESINNFFVNNKFDVVINCAAYTNVDEAEVNKDIAYKVNGKSIGYLCNAIEKNYPRTIFIHISTDYVFDGDFSNPISEKQKPNPISKYGESKLLGEKILQHSIIPSIIIRVSWLYSKFGNNFMKTIIKLSQDKESIDVINDQIGSPTSAKDLAKTIISIIKSNNLNSIADHKEVFNYCNFGSCSWYEFAKEILTLTSSTCKVVPITSKKYKTKAKRPRYSVLDTTKIVNSFGIEINTWQAALEKTIKDSIYNKSI